MLLGSRNFPQALPAPFIRKLRAASPLACHPRAVEVFLDLRTVAGTLETCAEELGFFERDRRAIQPAHEFGRCPPLAGAGAALGQEHAVAADAGIDPLMGGVE